MSTATVERTAVSPWTFHGPELENFESYCGEGENPKGAPLYNVPLTLINAFMFPNVRQELHDIDDMIDTLDETGQIQPILVCRVRHKEDHLLTALGQAAGFRRMEAYRQKALGGLVEKYNTEKNLNKKDKGFLCFDDPTWFLKLVPDYEQEATDALSKVTVNCNVMYFASKKEAWYAQIAENFHRSDVPIGDLIDRIMELYDMGEKRDDIAKGLGKLQPSAISNYEKVGAMPYYLEQYVCTGDVWETLPDNAKADRLAIAELLREDMLRRLHLPKSDDRALKFTTLRSFSGVVMYGNDRALSTKSFSDKYLHQECALEVIKFLCRWDSNSNRIAKDSPAPDLGAFNQFMVQMEARSTAMRREGSPVTIDTPVGESMEGVQLAPTGIDAASLDIGTSETLQQKVAPQQATSADVQQQQAIAGVTGMEPQVAGEPVSETAEGEEAEGEEEFQETLDDQMEGLVGGDAGDTGTAGSVVADAVTRQVTSSKPDLMPKIQINPGSIIKLAQDYSEWADDQDQDVPAIDKLAFCQTAGQLWALCGFEGKSEVYATRFDAFRAELLSYFAEMEQKAREGGFNLEVPVMQPVPDELAHVNVAAAREDAVLSDDKEEEEVDEEADDVDDDLEDDDDIDKDEELDEDEDDSDDMDDEEDEGDADEFDDSDEDDEDGMDDEVDDEEDEEVTG